MAVDINVTKSKEEKIKDVLKSHFESDIRSDIGLCSYLIFPDGTLISGYAHRDMLDYLVDAGVIGASHSSDNDDEYGQWDTDIFNEVFNCIRCTDIDNDENYIGLPDTPLTDAQYKVLEKWIDNNINLGRPVLQVTTRYHWDDQHNVFYNYKEIMEHTWPTEYIIKKIKKYYNTGKLEEELDIIPGRETQMYSYHSDDILLNVVVPGTEWAGKAYSRISFSFEKELSKKVSEKLFNDGYTGVQDFKAHECTLSKYSRVIWSGKSWNLRVEFPANDSIENFFRPLLTEEDFKAVFDSEAYYLIKNDLEPLDEKIVKKGSKWQVQSEKGRNLGTYDTKPEAEKRLQQVHYFKHKNEDLDLEILPDVSAVPSVRQAPYGFTRYEIIDPEYKEEIIAEIPDELSAAKEKYRNHLNDDWYLFVWNGSKNQGYINVFKDGKRVIGMYNDGLRPSMPIVQEIVANAASINESVSGLIREDFDIIDNKKIDKEEIHASFGGKLIGERWLLDDSRKDILYNLLNTPDHNMADLDRLYHDENIAWTVAKYYNTESNFAPDCYLQFKNLSTGLSVSGWGMFGLPISEEQFNAIITDTGLEEDLEIMPGPDDSWKEYHDKVDTYFGLPISDAEHLILKRWEEFSWYLAVYNPESGVWVDGLYGDLEDNINGVMSFPEAFEKFKALELRPGERVVLCYHQGAEYDENDELDFGEENYPILTKGEVTPENELYEDLDILEAPEYNKEYLTYHINYKPENIIKNYWHQDSWYLMTTDEQYYTLSGALKELHDYNGLGTFKEMYDAFLNYDFAGDETSVYLMWYDVDDEFSEEFEILKRDRYTFEEELDVMDSDSVIKSLLTTINDNDIIEKLEETYNIYINEEGKPGYVKQEDNPAFGSDLEDEAFDYIERHWIQLRPSSDSLYSNLNHIFIEMPMNKLTPGQVQWLKKNSDWLQDCPDYNVSINDAVDDVTEFLDVHGYLTEEFEVINGFPPGHVYSDNGQNYYVMSPEQANAFLPEFITHLKSWNHDHSDIEFLENILETHEQSEYDVELIKDDQKVYVIVWDMDGNSLEIGTGLDTWYRKWNNVVHFKEIPTWNHLEEELDVVADPHPEIIDDKKSKTTYTLPLVCCQKLLDALIELLGYSKKQRTLIELRDNLEEQPEQPIKLIVWHHFNIFMLEYDLNVKGMAYELAEVEDENDLRNINGEICKVIDDMFGWNYLETFLKENRVDEELDLDIIEIPDYRHNYDVHINYGGPQNPDEVIAKYYGEEVWALDVESQATGNVIGRGWEGDLAEGFNGWFTFDEGYKKLLEYTNNYRFYKSISVHLCCKYTLNNYEGIYSILFRYIDGKDIIEQLKELKEDFEEISSPSEKYIGDVYLNGLYKVGNDNILDIINYTKDHPNSMKVDASTSTGPFDVWEKHKGNISEILEEMFNTDVIWMYFSKEMDRDREDANITRRYWGKLLLVNTHDRSSFSFNIDNDIIELIKKNAVEIQLKAPTNEELDIVDTSELDKNIKSVLVKFLLDMGEYVCEIGNYIFEGYPSGLKIDDTYYAMRDAAYGVEGGQITVKQPQSLESNFEEKEEWDRIETAYAHRETNPERFLQKYSDGKADDYEEVFYKIGELWGLSRQEMDDDYLSLIK